jgi:hypothetical protein
MRKKILTKSQKEALIRKLDRSIQETEQARKDTRK